MLKYNHTDLDIKLPQTGIKHENGDSNMKIDILFLTYTFIQHSNYIEIQNRHFLYTTNVTDTFSIKLLLY